MDWLKTNRASDEEVVAIVETDACGADAVQVLTGCTFGKGNFIFKDYGKTAFTFFSRESGRGVRIVLKPEAAARDKRHQELLGKLRDGSATGSDRREFEKLHEKKSHEILGKPVETLFNLNEVKIEAPPKAKMAPSKPCARCGEPTMATKLSEIGGQMICRGCLAK
jgi:formylmethanofuran dehydrogenase subunit E